MIHSLLIISSRAVVREGIATIVQSSPYLRVTGLVAHVDDVLGLDLPTPDVILYDTGIRPWPSLHGLRALQEKWPSTQILGMVVEQSEQVKGALAQAGVYCWVPDETTGEQLIENVLSLARNACKCMPTPDHTRARSPGHRREHALSTLTPREYCVLEMLAQGCPNKEIADRLGLREMTVKSYLKIIYDKLGVSNRVEAACAWQGWHISVTQPRDKPDPAYRTTGIQPLRSVGGPHML